MINLYKCFVWCVPECKYFPFPRLITLETASKLREIGYILFTIPFFNKHFSKSI